MPRLTVGFVPRERFSLAAKSLESILEHTPKPYRLIVVDCNIPAVYRSEMDAVLSRFDDVQVIRRDHYLRPNQSKNLVIAEAKDDYLCLIENDVLVGEGWIDILMAACEEHPADVAVPLILEGPLKGGAVHFDELLGTVNPVDTPEGTKLEIQPRKGKRQNDRGSSRRTVQFMEQHCLLFRREVFDRIGPFDEELNTRDEIDLSLALHAAGARVVFEPRCTVAYFPPFPPREDELPYFFFKWDLARAERSRDRIREKWNLTECPGDMGFVKDRNLIGSLHLLRKQIEGLVSPGRSFILVDGDNIRGTDVVSGLPILPFIEKDGQYWGAPEDDETAIREVERMRGAGAAYIGFAWPAFWWLSHYGKFHEHLKSSYPSVIESDHMVVFDLQEETVRQG
jgi:GT2 family glycosyltransferase